MEKTKLMLEVENKIGEELDTYLPRRYNHENLSSDIIAEKLDVHPITVRRWLRKLEIPIRNAYARTNRLSSYELSMNYNYIRKPMRELAEEYGVNVKTCYRWLEYEGIERRHGSDAHLPVGIKRPNKNELARTYEKYNYSILRTAQFYNISGHTARKWLREEDLFIQSIKRESIYDDINIRKKALDKVKSKTQKEKIRVCDFRKTKKKDKKSYYGLLQWYERKYNCNSSEAVRKLIEEFD